MVYEEVSDYYPSCVEIETTSHCNINPPCPMCARALRSVKDEHHISNPMMSKCRSLMEKSKLLSLTGIGEPLIDPRFGDLIAINKTGFLVFTSNAQLLTSKNIDIILSRPVDRVTFSLDAATPHTYEKIRGYNLSTFGQVIGQIDNLIQTRNSRGLDKPAVRLGFVVMRENFHEIPSFVLLAHRLKVEGVAFWPLNTYEGVPEFVRNGWRYNETEQHKIPPSYMDEITKYGKYLHMEYGFSLDWRTKEGAA